MTVAASFQYDGGEEDMREDDPSIKVEDYFGAFALEGTCAHCKASFEIASFELA